MTLKEANIEIAKCDNYMDYMESELKKVGTVINGKEVTLKAEIVNDVIMMIQEYKTMLENRQIEPWWK